MIRRLLLLSPLMILHLILHSGSPVGADTSTGRTNAGNLIKGLLSQYDASVRPMSESSQTTIEFSASLVRIQDLDEKKQMFTALFWIHLIWNDTRLEWDPSIYKNFDTVTVPASKIWIPDITLYNGVDIDGSQTFIKSNVEVMISNSGIVHYVTPLNARTFCAIDPIYFPFDEQICELRFGSWSSSFNVIDMKLESDNLDFTTYYKNTNWDIIVSYIQRHVFFASYAKVPQSSVTISLHLRRKSESTGFYLILPYLLVLFLATLVFCLPPERWERVTLNIVFILMTVLNQMRVLDQLPSTSVREPLIVTYGFYNIILLSVFLAATLLLYKIQTCGGEGGRRLPRFIRVWILQKLANILWCGSCCRNRESMEDHDKTRPAEDTATHLSRKGLSSVSPSDGYECEWKKLALIVDRLMFIIFFVVAIIITILIFVNFRIVNSDAPLPNGII